jgi:uncharacterized protein
VFSWDARKAVRNRKKHGIPFEEAATIFADPNGLDWKDLEHAETVPPWKRLALLAEGHILMVVYPLRRLRNGVETIRIISARQASPKEREAYAG